MKEHPLLNLQELQEVHHNHARYYREVYLRTSLFSRLGSARMSMASYRAASASGWLRRYENASSASFGLMLSEPRAASNVPASDITLRRYFSGCFTECWVELSIVSSGGDISTSIALKLFRRHSKEGEFSKRLEAQLGDGNRESETRCH
jgi:hypothetical protein